MNGSDITILQQKNRMNREFDDVIETCLLEKLPIREALGRVLPVLCRNLGSRDVLIRTIDENLNNISLKSGKFRPEWSALVPREFPDKEFPPMIHSIKGGYLIVASLDVVDQLIGLCGFVFTGVKTPDELEVLADLVDTAAEMLDNYLEGIASNARKQSITMYSTEALRNRIFEAGADKAVSHLCDELKIDEFILVYGDMDSAMGEDLRYRYYVQGEMEHNSIDSSDSYYQAILDDKEKALNLKDRSFSALLGSRGIIEKPLQNGMNHSLIGKLIIKPKGRGLNPESMDIIRIFAECLCQRLFDYNRERRYLAKCFCAGDVQRLLSEPDFYEKYLSPREEDIVILYTDITSFTSICEKVLENASEIGELINQWSRKILEILYRHDGVFDKMVGDCVIGLFGPPFFESSMEKRVKDALAAAEEIVRETIALGEILGIEKKIIKAGIADHLTTSNGIHSGPTSVGFFGPNEDYTGFSSAMNQAARLQGHAAAGDVLVTESALAHLPGGPLGITLHKGICADFEGPRMIVVKNVSEPLDYFRCVFSKP